MIVLERCVKTMDDTIREFSGKIFTAKEIDLIKWITKTYLRLSVYELSLTICELLDWTTPAGSAKTSQCVSFLEQLEKEGVLKLPPRAERGKNKRTKVKIEFDTREIAGDIKAFEPIELVIARRGEDLDKWGAYVDQYHMLGYKNQFGSRLQYFIKSGELELGCIQFSASSWALKDRDDWIGWEIEDKKQRLNLIINNSRYLIFPWVQIPNLASKTLSLAIKQIQEDWLSEFCYAPVLLETFVDRQYFKGTCYKASNWIYLGQTKGNGRNSTNHKPNRSKKDIYAYPLEKNFRAFLKGEIPCKVVNPNGED